MVPRRDMHPQAPYQPNEIAASVDEAVAMGISMVHLHARDGDDQPTLEPGIYADIIGRIREHHPELVICVSLSGRNGASLAQRLAPLDLAGDLRPDMASLTLSSLNFTRQASVNAPDAIRALAERMIERGVMPEIEVFDLGMANVLRYLSQRNLFRSPLYVNVLLGNLAGAQADMLHAATLLAGLPDGVTWAFGGLGSARMTAHALALAAGGGVRVGLEDSLFLDNARQIPATNAKLLHCAHRLIEAHHSTVTTPAELRQQLGLLPGFGHYGRPPASL